MRYVDEVALGLFDVLRRRVFVERLRGCVECGSWSKMWSCGCAPTGTRRAAAALSVPLCSLSVCCSSSDESRMLPVVVTSTSVSVTFGGG
jgi:hypothetical protein